MKKPARTFYYEPTFTTNQLEKLGNKTMLKRTLEPEVMDTVEEAATYDEMDHRQVNVQFVSDLLEFADQVMSDFQSPSDSPQRAVPSPHAPQAGPLDQPARPWTEVLDLGTGTARIPIELCCRTERVRVLAVDESASMLDIARINIELAQLSDRIMLDRKDAKQLDFPAQQFNAIVSNSLIHHLAEPGSCLEQLPRLLNSGGILFLRDLMRPQTADEVDRLVATYAAEESSHAQQLFHNSLHAALTLAEIRDIVTDLGFPAESVQATSDRHWTWAAPP